MYSYLRFCFRHIQTYSSILQQHTHAYSEPWVSLAYSEPWHILITKHIQTPRYLHNTILNIFTKTPSWTFNRVLDVSHLFFIDANPIQDSPETSTNLGISLKNFLTFSFSPFATLVWNFKFSPSASPKLFNLNQDHPSKKVGFFVKSLSNWGCDNFCHRNARVTKLWSHEPIYNIIWITW